MWAALSQTAFDRIFCQPATADMEPCEENHKGFPVCSICNHSSLDLKLLQSCQHPVCQECLTVLQSQLEEIPVICKKCTQLGTADKDVTVQDQPTPSLKQEACQLDEQNFFSSSSSDGEELLNVLEKSIQNIRKAVLAASKHSLCLGCLYHRKQKMPDVTCLECNVSYCEGCSIKHTADHGNHVMLPEKRQEDQQGNKKNNKLQCEAHPDVPMALFCRDCEVAICQACAESHHSHCISVITLTTLVQEEKGKLEECSKLTLEAMKFFSEEHQQTQDALKNLTDLKKESQAQVRAFFSTLIKACMDVEGALLHELEMTTSDHLDVVQEQVQAWVCLQQQMQHLLELVELITLLYPGDFLPLSAATKTVLNKLLRHGENLVASAPPAMTWSLCLEQSSQRAVVKRINEIGSTALTIQTHSLLTLREITTTSFKVQGDRSEPLVTGLVLLNPQLLIAADFNNHCLKELRLERGSKEWAVINILKLKCRPHSITLLPKPKAVSRDPIISNTDKANNSLLSRLAEDEAGDIEQSAVTPLLENDGDGSSEEEPVVRADKELAVQGREQVAVSSPDGKFLVVSISITPSPQNDMSVVYSAQTERGYWGLSSINNKALVSSKLDQGHADLTILNDKGLSQRQLSLVSTSSGDVLVSPRHLATAAEGTHVLVADQGKKVLFVMASDGKVLSTFSGEGGVRLNRPEGLCVDSRGHIFLLDSAQNCLMMLTSTGRLMRQTLQGQFGLSCPQAICMDSNSYIYISNNSGKVLTVYEML